MQSTVSSDIKVINYFLTFLGIIPLNLKSRWIFLKYLYLLFILCILLTSSIFGLILLLESDLLLPSKILKLVIYTHLICLNMASWITIIFSNIRFQIYNSAIEKLTKIDNLLKNKLWVEIRNNLRNRKIVFSLLFFSFLLILLDYLLVVHNSSDIFKFNFITCHVAFLVISSTDFRAVLSFKQIKNRFKCVNQYLLNITKIDRNLLFNTNFTISHYSLSKSKIKELAYVHSNLIKITKKLNNYFSPIFLIEIVIFFSISICHAYHFFYSITISITYKEQKYLFHNIYWIIVVYIKLSLLLKSSISIIEQV